MRKKMKCLHLFSSVFLTVAIVLTSAGCQKIIYQDPVYSDVVELIPIEDEISSEEENSSLDDENSLYEDNISLWDDTVTSKLDTSSSKNENLNGNNSNSNNTIVDEGNYGKLENGTMVYNVSNFGAVGDGKTDDGVAINDAVIAAIQYTAKNAGKKAIVRFEKNKSYLCHKQNYTMSSSGATILIDKANNVTLEGSNSIIIGEPTKSYLRINSCSNIKIKGLNFTYDTPVACRAKVVKREGQWGETITFEVPEWYIKSVENNKLASSSFGVPVNNRRDHSWLRSIEKVDDTHCKVVFSSGGYTILRTEEELKTATDFRSTNYIDLPTPGYSHNGTAFRILYNRGNVEFENCNIWNASQFIFQITGNLENGNINFKNVNLTPRDSSSCPTVAWRDAIHAKDNRGTVSLDDCNLAGTHDDLFNISNTQLRVDAIQNGTTLKLYGLDYSGQYQKIYEGDTVVAFDPKFDKYYGEAKVAEVIQQEGNKIFIKLDKDIGVSEGAYLYFKEYATRVVINGGNFSGSVRIRGESIITKAKFTLTSMWTAYEGVHATKEGPIPENITYKNCIFEGANHETWIRMTFNCTLLDGKTASSYSVKNIVFDNCAFGYDNIIDRSKEGVIIK